MQKDRLQKQLQSKIEKVGKRWSKNLGGLELDMSERTKSQT